MLAAKETPIPAPAAPTGRFASLTEASGWYDSWLQDAALPLWASAGVDPQGGFREALTWSGAPHDPRRRARVQARQAFVFATAAAEGVPGDWQPVARRGFELFLSRGRRPDGLFASTLDVEGRQTDPAPRLYEHAFIILALAALRRLEPSTARWADEARGVREGLSVFRHAAGGFREADAEPFQANAQMHLFEAALAWEAIDPDAGWKHLSDELAELALTRFIDPRTGALGEVFDETWARAAGEAGRIEPGHQFEWAWLLEQWGATRGDKRARQAATRLFEVGRRGLDPARGTVANLLHDDLSVRDAAARLWPQTEHLKAALVLGEADAALQAANGLAAYLDTPVTGVWRERMRADGSFIEEPSPATSLYHLFLAIRELARGLQLGTGRSPAGAGGSAFARSSPTGSHAPC